MKKSIIAAFAICIAIGLKAQATLPASWDMGNSSSPITSPPAGWSYLNSNGGTLIYTSSGFYNSSPQALKLDATGEYLLCEFLDKPSKATFYIRHTGTSGAFTGVFDVLESANGSVWTTVKNYTTDMPGSLTLVSLNLLPTSRFVKWILTTKTSGFNISIDDVTIEKASGGANKEIVIVDSINDERIIKGGTLFLGNTLETSIKVKNLSTLNVLSIDSAILSGPDKQFFSLINMPTTIAAGGSAYFSVRLLNTGALGTKMATLTVYSDDEEGNSNYGFNLEAINGTLATEPANNATGLSFTYNKAWRLKASFTDVGAQNYLVLSNNSTITDMPADNTSYEKGAYIGSSRIVYIGAAKQFEMDKIEANTSYFVKVFSFNGKNGFENYLTTGAPEINTTTAGLNAGTYYSTVDVSKPSFVTDLKSKIKPHFQVYYSNYAPYIVDNFEAYDTTGNKKVLTCYYTGYKYIYSPPLIWSTMSREHSYPYSYMGEQSKDSANYSDLHILFPVNQDNANAIRSNFPLGIVKSPTFQFLGGKVGTDSLGIVVYEPLDATKGIVARANFYICAAYNSNSTKFTIPTANQFLNQNQDQWLLKKWNLQYPPSNREIARHEYIASVQNNRNPFIDNPNWACYIDFSNMTYLASGDCNSPKKSVNNINTVSITISPNPSSHQFTIAANAFTQNNVQVSVFDITGALVLEQQVAKNNAVINHNLAAGTYLVLVKTSSQIAVSKIIID